MAKGYIRAKRAIQAAMVESIENPLFGIGTLVRYKYMPLFVGRITAIHIGCVITAKDRRNNKKDLYDVDWYEAPPEAMTIDGTIGGIPFKCYEHTKKWDRTGRCGYELYELEVIA